MNNPHAGQIAVLMHMAHLSLYEAAFAFADNRSQDVNITNLIVGLDNLVLALKEKYAPEFTANSEALIS